MKAKNHAGVAVLLLGILGCQPIFAIGWREILIVVLIAVFLLGPPVYKFIRRFEEYRKQKDK